MIEIALAAAQAATSATTSSETVTPWFPAESAWILGPVLGGGVGGILCGGIGGGVCGILAQKGKARRFVMSYFAFLTALGLVSLGVGLTALLVDQPYHVWYPFTLMGGILLFCVPFVWPALCRQYRLADERKLEADALRTA